MLAADIVPKIKHPERVFIDGSWIFPEAKSFFNLINPATEEPFFRVAEAGTADVHRAVAAARRAFDDGPWTRVTVAERAHYLRAMSDYLDSRHPELAAAWTKQMGALNSFASAMTPFGSGLFRDYAAIGESFPFVERHASQMPEIKGVDSPLHRAPPGLLVREAVGVVAAIVPWNTPLSAATIKLAPALIAGCTVVLKAAPETPIEAYIIAEAAEAIGLPKGVLNVVVADRAASEELVRHPDVDKISFTGSSAVGKRIASQCGERIARYTLELGGKSAGVVLDDFEPAHVAAAIAGSTCVLSNQVCASLSRIIVTRKRHNALVDAFRETFGRIRVGDPYDPQSEMGPLAMKRQLFRVQGYVEKAKNDGADLIVGGGTPKGLDRGYYVEPTIFANVDNGSALAQEEVFGPVIAIIAADDEAHAVKLANASVFGLNSAVFTNDVDRAYDVGRQLRAGTVGHNSFKMDMSIAFGGFKQSGVGREGGREGLMPFLETKTMLLNGEPATV